jgi:hypothetical protein
MRLSRLTICRLMALVPVVAIVLWIRAQSETDAGSTRGIGHVSIPLVFVVSGVDSGQPIEGAVIHLKDFDNQSHPIPPYFLELKTGRDGRATILVDLPFYESRGIPSGRLRFYRVAYPRWEIKVAADGHQDVVASFADYERRNGRFHEDVSRPPIAISLRRTMDINEF